MGDLMMVSVLGNLRNTQALASLPRLTGYVARAEERPAHVKAMAAQLMFYEAADRAMQQMQQG